MDAPLSIGEVPWSREELTQELERFASLYRTRPICDNTGGMKAPHMFLAWFVMKKLQPKVIIESGVWLGQGTWLLEQACPDAQLICIEPYLDRIRYRPKHVQYFKQDFSMIDWNHLPKDDTILFFDDHQNAYERVRIARWFGFKQMLFEDNYPPSQGDCYSLKRVLMGAGFSPPSEPVTMARAILRQAARSILGSRKPRRGHIAPNQLDAAYLKANAITYCELPPVFKPELTRWNDRWDPPKYPTPEPLLQSVVIPAYQVFWDEANSYTWMCYLKLR